MKPYDPFIARLIRLTLVWIDRWVRPATLADPASSLRARVLVATSMVAVTVSILVQSIRLNSQDQHWLALASWAVCTLLFMLVPVIVRTTGSLAFAVATVSTGALVGAIGVAIREGGLASPNATVMIVVPATATLVGGWRSGAVVALLVTLLSGAMYSAHLAAVLTVDAAVSADTLLLMRAVLVAALGILLYFVTFYYEVEGARTQRQLDEAKHATQNAILDASRIKLELLASQQRETQKDLQLTAAVQRLLLPRRDTIVTENVELSGFSLPANDAGGDWWSAETFGDGRARIMVGDVTGHGVAPAMVAAVVAGAYRGLRELERRDARAVLELLHSVLMDVSAGRYTMPFGLLDVFADGRATWLSAASPPPLVMRARGESVESLVEPGTPLGHDVLRIGERSFQLAEGDRIFVCSDGVQEMRIRGGHELGGRRLAGLLRSVAACSVHDARDQLVASLHALRGEERLHDDVTFALIERRAACVVKQSC